MRIVKEAAERRNERLDVAERLFCTNGYDNTSTNDILAEIGIARGTLYYHFKNKEDILDAMIDRILDETVRKAESIALDESVPVLERLTKTVLAANVDTKTGSMILECGTSANTMAEAETAVKAFAGSLADALEE